eukprot:g32378.t1
MSSVSSLLPAPNVASEDDADQSNRAPQPQPVPFGSGVATGMACPAGKTSRPDTCFMTHRYVKQEIAYLARRIDEVGRYFLALESMVGSGALGPVLERCLKDLEECLQEPDKYKPLQNRLSWLNHGRRHQEIQTELATAAPFADDAVGLQQSIDDGVRSGIGAQELQRARQRLDQLKENETNEEMLRAACRGDFTTVELKLRKEDEDRVAVIRTAQASCPVENAVSLQKTAPEKQTETPDIVNEELNTVVSSVGVIGTATVVAIAGIGHVLDVDEKNTQGTEKCTVHCCIGC